MQEDKHVAEITHLLSRAAGWPTGPRWIVRQTKPSRRQAKNLTVFEHAICWWYLIIVTTSRTPGSRTLRPATTPSSSTCRTASSLWLAWSVALSVKYRNAANCASMRFNQDEFVGV
jgi:hypothetical protein